MASTLSLSKNELPGMTVAIDNTTTESDVKLVDQEELIYEGDDDKPIQLTGNLPEKLADPKSDSEDEDMQEDLNNNSTKSLDSKIKKSNSFMSLDEIIQQDRQDGRNRSKLNKSERVVSRNDGNSAYTNIQNKNIFQSSVMSQFHGINVHPNTDFKSSLTRLQPNNDFSSLKDPSLVEIEKVVRKVIKHNNALNDRFDKRKIRPNALFAVGVNELSTEDVLGYFSGLGPTKLEWIDDNSCNIVWEQQDDCIKSFLKISKEQVITIVQEPPKKLGEDEKTEFKSKLMADGTEKIVEKEKTTTDVSKEIEKLEKDKQAMPPPALPGMDSREVQEVKMPPPLPPSGAPLLVDVVKREFSTRISRYRCQKI